MKLKHIFVLSNMLLLLGCIGSLILWGNKSIPYLVSGYVIGCLSVSLYGYKMLNYLIKNWDKKW